MTDIWIYHERQEALLCGQHALNNLVQEAAFNVGDLSDIAHQLDQMELNYMANTDHGVDSKDYIRRVAEGSGNVDPSGNFSIEVLRSALLTRYNLSLPSLSSETTSKLEITTLAGFICNKESHWFAIRKINERYWNLNSTLERPQSISNFHLAMEMEALQKSGYSVFTIIGDENLPKVCRNQAERLRGQAQFWWKEDDLVKGKTNAMTADNNPWKNVGTGMRLDGKSTADNRLSSHMGMNLTEEEMLQMALSASLEAPKVSNVKLNSEPAATDPGAVRIQFRLPNGKKTIRRFLETETVEMLYKFVEEACQGEGQGRRLELKAGFPPKSLEAKSDISIKDAALSDETVRGRFV